MNLNFTTPLNDKADKCKGTIYQYSREFYREKNGSIVMKDKLRPMNSLSCKGCEKCYGIKEMVDEYISNGCEIEFSPVRGCSMYCVEVYNSSYDYESGHYEHDVRFVPYRG